MVEQKWAAGYTVVVRWHAQMSTRAQARGRALQACLCWPPAHAALPTEHEHRQQTLQKHMCCVR